MKTSVYEYIADNRIIQARFSNMLTNNNWSFAGIVRGIEETFARNCDLRIIWACGSELWGESDFSIAKSDREIHRR